MTRVAVVGAGVIGLSIAHELARGGLTVEVVSDQLPSETTSAVAGAIWFPHSVEDSPRAAHWSSVTLGRLTALAPDASWGILLSEGTYLEHDEHPDRTWVDAVPWHEEVPAAQLPPGARSAIRTRLPIITMPTYLARLTEECRRRGVTFTTRRVGALDEFAGVADAVVIAAGLRAGELVADDELVPVRGQIVRVHNPGLTEWVIADSGYVFPRHDDIVLGGSADVGEWDTTHDPALEQDILARAAVLVPDVAELPVVSRAVGLRPTRRSIRFEAITGGALPTFACYGHGGAGVTLSWGCAIDAAAQIRALIDGARA